MIYNIPLGESVRRMDFNMEDKISVVVPIYNVEKYLIKCIDSIINQTYKNLEIILVDDGSPDSSGKIAEDFKIKDSRIKVIHKENGGLSDARNVGIDNATGKYIVFIDSDDYVEKEFVEELYKALDENIKIAQCGIKKVNDNFEILEEYGYKESVKKSGSEMLKDTYTHKNYLENTVVWNKIYDINLFKNIRFPKGKIHEDEYTTYKLFYGQENIKVINKNLYNYRQAPDSITGKKYNLKRLDIIDAYEERLEFFKDKDINLYKMILKVFLGELIIDYIKVKKYVENSKEARKKIIKIYKKYYKIYKTYNEGSFKYKLKMKLFGVIPDLFYMLGKQKY